MKSETILKLKKVDKLMFTVNQTDDPDDQLKIVIKFLNDFGMLNGDVSSAQVVEAYNQNVLTKIRKIIKIKLLKIVNILIRFLILIKLHLCIF